MRSCGWHRIEEAHGEIGGHSETPAEDKHPLGLTHYDSAENISQDLYFDTMPGDTRREQAI